MRNIVVALGLVVPLCGCAVGPDYVGPPQTGSLRYGQTRTQTSQPAPHGWWRIFRDPVLNGLIEEAVAGNQDVAAAKARIREARAVRAEAVGGLFPAVSGSGSLLREKSAATGTGTSEFTQHSGGFDASWELDLFGAQYRDVEAASRGVEAAHDDLDYIALTLAGDVAAYYIDARGARERIAIARRNASEQRQIERMTRTKLEAGSVTPSDVAKASALAFSTEAEIPSYESAFAAAAHRVGVLLGQSPDAVIARLSTGAGVPRPANSLRVGLPADLLRNRPDLRRAERQLAQATARIGQAEASLYPDVSLTGNIASSALKASDFAKASTVSWSFGPAISIPVFQGGKLLAAVDVARAQRDENVAAYHSAVLTAVEDVENAVVALSTERRRMNALTASASNYATAARMARTVYENGSSSFLDLLDSQRSLRSAEDSVIQSRMAYAKDHIALAKALGGGWDRPIDSDTPLVKDVDTGPHPRSAGL